MSIDGEEDKKHYCCFCKLCFSRDELISKRNNDGEIVKRVCPNCFGQISVICSECSKGLMLKVDEPHSYDFDIDGHIIVVCSECLYSFKVKTADFYMRYEEVNISRRRIKTVVDKVFTRQHLPYVEKEQVQNKIFNNCSTKEEIVKTISVECGESPSFLRSQLF